MFILFVFDSLWDLLPTTQTPITQQQIDIFMILRDDGV